MKIFLTGGSGFIGKEFLSQAKTAGHEVYAIGRNWAGTYSLQWWEEEMKRYSAVVHLAAAGVRQDRNWEVCMQVNFEDTRDMLENILCSGSTPVVYIAGTVRQTETMERPELWDDPYVVSKVLAERYILEWSMRYKGQLIYPMLAPCYGPGEVQAVAASILTAIT